MLKVLTYQSLLAPFNVTHNPKNCQNLVKYPSGEDNLFDLICQNLEIGITILWFSHRC